MKTSRTLTSVGAALLLALLAPLGADARPPQPAGSAAPQASVLARLPSITGAHLAISQLTSAPTHVRAGRTYVVRGAIVNEGSAAARGRVVVRLLRVGSRPLTIGGAPVDLAAHDSTGFSVRVRLPVRYATARTRSSRARDARGKAARSGASRRSGISGSGRGPRRTPAPSPVLRARRARPARTRCRRSEHTSTRKPATAATRASTRTSS